VVKAEDIVDFSQREGIAEKVARRFGASIASNPAEELERREVPRFATDLPDAAIGLAPADQTFAVEALLRLFAPEPDRARARLRTFVEDRML